MEGVRKNQTPGMQVKIGQMYLMSLISMFEKNKNRYIITLGPDKEQACDFKMTEQEFTDKYGPFLKSQGLEYQFSTQLL